MIPKFISVGKLHRMKAVEFKDIPTPIIVHENDTPLVVVVSYADYVAMEAALAMKAPATPNG